MNTIYINKFRYMPMINSQIKFETLVWRLMKGLTRNEFWMRVEVKEIWKVSGKCDSNLATAIT